MSCYLYNYSFLKTKQKFLADWYKINSVTRAKPFPRCTQFDGVAVQPVLQNNLLHTADYFGQWIQINVWQSPRTQLYRKHWKIMENVYGLRIRICSNILFQRQLKWNTDEVQRASNKTVVLTFVKSRVVLLQKCSSVITFGSRWTDRRTSTASLAEDIKSAKQIGTGNFRQLL